MADKSINQLPVSDGLSDDGLLVVYQNGATKSITGSLVKQFATQGVESALTAAKESGEFDGQDGKDGTDGVSPTITVTDITGGHRLTITDANGTQTVDIMDGEDGADGTGGTGTGGTDGEDGFSPTIAVTEITGGHRLTITDVNGTQTVDIMDGEDGKDGEAGTDGVSPTINVTEITGGHRLTITDVYGTKTVDVMDGADGTGGTGTGGVSSWNDLTDKPFEDNRTIIYQYTDGYTPLDSKLIPSDYADYYMYKVSNTPMTKAELIGTHMEWVTVSNGVKETEKWTFTSADIEVSGDLTIADNVISVAADTDMGTVYEDYAGIVLTTGLWVKYSESEYISLLYSGEVDTIDEIYLPEHVMLPTVTAEDDGKILQVVNGAWSAVAITDGNTVAY